MGTLLSAAVMNLNTHDPSHVANMTLQLLKTDVGIFR